MDERAGEPSQKHPSSKNLGRPVGTELVYGYRGTWMLITLLNIVFTLLPLISKNLTIIYTFYWVQKTMELIYCKSGFSKYWMRSKSLDGQ